MYPRLNVQCQLCFGYNLKFTTTMYNHWGCGNLQSQYGPASLHHQTSIWACLQPSWLCQKGQKSPEEHVDSGTAPPKYRIRPIKLPRWLYPILPKDKEIARSTILKLKRKFHSHEKEKTWKVRLQNQDFVLKSHLQGKSNRRWTSGRSAEWCIKCLVRCATRAMLGRRAEN